MLSVFVENRISMPCSRHAPTLVPPRCRSSWSKLYGDDGFIKIARGSNDCGISTQGAIAVVSKQIAESRRQA